jgi:integrase/recombinase XerD
MGRKGRVGVLLRINTGDGKYTYIKPVWDGNKLKPLVGILNGTEVHRPEGRYYLRYTELGKNHLEPVGNDPADVLIFLKVRQAKLVVFEAAKATGLKVVPVDENPGRVTIQASINAYLAQLERDERPEKSVSSKRFELGEFARFCPRRFMDELTRDDMVDYRKHLKKHGNVKTKGALHDTSVYNRLISIATWLKQNPLFPMRPLLKYPDDYPEKVDGDPEPYEPEEIVRLRKACADNRERLILDFFLATGCREQEVAHVEFADLIEPLSVVRITKRTNWKPKTRAGKRDIPISPKLMERLLATKSGERKLIFPSPTGLVEKHFLDRLFYKLGDRTGVAHMTCHRFRDTFATVKVDWAKNVQQLRSVARWLGHSNLETLDVYARFLENRSQVVQESSVQMDTFGGEVELLDDAVVV